MLFVVVVIICDSIRHLRFRRDTDFTGADFEKLIAKCATQKATGLPWAVNDDLRQKYGVKDKVHPLFLMSKPPATPKTPTSHTARTQSASSSRTSEPSSKRSKLASASDSASLNGKATSSATDGHGIVQSPCKP